MRKVKLMANKTKIEWADATLNIATGCTRVSPGCDNCYMFEMWDWLQNMNAKGYEGKPDKPTIHLDMLAKPLIWKAPRKIFLNSMSDTFHRDIDYKYINMMFNTMLITPHHTYQVLTKRPGRALQWWRSDGEKQFDEWPPNVWIGTSVETQKYTERIKLLSQIPAEIRFVSVEPLLDAVDLTEYIDELNWVIVGGESGINSRPMNPEWVRSIRDQCEKHNTPFFFKQWGGVNKKKNGNTLDGKTYLEFPIQAKKGMLIA